MTDRDPYADVGRAMRDSLDRALAADLTVRDWKVLGSIYREIASWSRLSDRVNAARLAELTGMDERAVRRSVVKLAAVGAITRKPSRGRYPSRYGLPWSSATSIDPADPGRERPVSRPSTLVVDDPPTLVADDHPAEKPAEENAAAAFAQLVAEVGLSGRVRLEMYEVWKSERARVEACVNEWSKRRAKRADIGPGLLVRMVRDGDDPAANGRRPRRAPSLPCPECEVGGGQHAADCPTLARAGS